MFIVGLCATEVVQNSHLQGVSLLYKLGLLTLELKVTLLGISPL